jgi:glyoxylase-like metal-dependent hydrolase (beta-lactamase superfamily II)
MKAADPIIAAAQRLGAPIRRIALTHGHGDHVGSLDALKEKLADAVPVLMPADDARIHSGDRVGSLEVVPTPGHTPGHVSLFDTRDGTLIAGDVFTTFGGVEVTNHLYWRFPLAAMATEDKGQDLESARALQALQPQLLLVGHGNALREPAAAIERALARAL